MLRLMPQVFMFCGRPSSRRVQRLFLLARVSGHDGNALFHQAPAFPRQPGLQLQSGHQTGGHRGGKVVLVVLTLTLIHPASPMHRATRWRHKCLSSSWCFNLFPGQSHSLEVLLYHISPVHPWPARSSPEFRNFPVRHSTSSNSNKYIMVYWIV